MEINENSVEIGIPKKIGVFEDKKTKVKSFYLPFKFLDGTNGAITITKFRKEEWNPSKDIKSIKVFFNED